ncbi:MAG TPA: SRPBCC family protein [Ktedonobacterales bacterium]|jgi:uncharacterized membrane protein
MQSMPVETMGNRLVFEESTEVEAPIGEVYRRWTDFAHFPEFMSNVKEVRPIGGDRYHWAASIFGTKQEWDADVTEREPNRRVSWRSTNGAYNAGTVSFAELSPSRTEVRARMEYTPPAGQVGRTLDKLTQTTRRQVKEDLHNFRRVASGERGITGEWESREGFGGVMATLAVPVAAGVITGTGAWFLEDQLVRSRTTAKDAKGAKAARLVRPTVNPVAPEADLASWIWLGLAGGSIAASATLRSMGRRHDALFVGQWTPTLIATGLLSRFIGRREYPHPVANAASYAFAGASLGSVLSSVVTHARGKRSDGLFIGQWAPTFLGLSLLMRLLGR